jgi:hypothetical protein
MEVPQGNLCCGRLIHGRWRSGKQPALRYSLALIKFRCHITGRWKIVGPKFSAVVVWAWSPEDRRYMKCVPVCTGTRTSSVRCCVAVEASLGCFDIAARTLVVTHPLLLPELNENLTVLNTKFHENQFSGSGNLYMRTDVQTGTARAI